MSDKELPLVFVHTPKCGGSYVNQILKDLKIKTKKHHRARPNVGIVFTVLRDPVDRFESLLNYRLQRGGMKKWRGYSLNEIVSMMRDEEILNFRPYRTLTFCSKNVDIFILIDQLHEFLSFFGFEYDPKNYSKVNVSKKTRGTFSEETRERIDKIFHEDRILFDTMIKK